MTRGRAILVCLAGVLVLPACPHYTASGAACNVQVQCPSGYVCGSDNHCEASCRTGESLCNGQCTTSSTCSPSSMDTVPGAPTNVTATPGAGAASVSWTAPASDGGAPIISYTVTAVPGDISTTTTGATTVTVSGLSPGVAYTFTVYAANKVGNGPASQPSPPITLANVPNAPTDVTASAGVGEATVAWTAPANDGGSPITGYTVTSHPGDVSAHTTGATMTRVMGLTGGETYTFTVTATNAAGDSPSSEASSPVTLPADPGAPTHVTVTAGVGEATVSWTAPSTNGSAITGYTVTASPGGAFAFTANATTAIVTGLSNGGTYTFTVVATNAVGDGPPSAATEPITLPSIPDVPVNVVAMAGVGQATVSWDEPSDNGSSITSYTITNVQTGVTVTSSTTSTTITGLTNGASYTFTVTATNAVGTSAASAPSAPITLPNVPGTPTGVSASAGDRKAVLTWTAPANNGSPITSYTVKIVQTGQTVSSSTTSATVTGLTNGGSYTFTVTATNAVGTGPASSPTAAITPAAVPDQPTNVVATAGNQQATVTWTAPSANGNPITQYTVKVVQTGATVTSSTTSATVTGLTNGSTYTFTVTATNAFGTSPASNPSAAITLATVPSAPTNVVATPGNQQATVSWFAPLSGGSPITSYTVTVVQTGATVTSTTTSATVTGLTNGSTYTFTVTATNAVGTSAASSPSSPLTMPTIPGAPTNVVATPGNQQVTLTWSAPASNGGSAITSYAILGTPGGSATTAGATSVIVTGLTNGQSYTFVVFAGNMDGYGPASDSSMAVTPATVPNAPTDVSATPDDRQATVSWSAPADTGGDPITGYTVTVVQTSATFSTGTTSATVTGLTNGSSYTFTVTATTVAGTGAASSPSSAVIPATVPDAPTNVIATAGDLQATVIWTAPFNEGRTISSYTVTVVETGATISTGTTSATVTGLLFGSSYTFTVTATNAIGTGAASLPSSPVTINDAAPTNLTYSANPVIFTVNQPVTDDTPASSGGAVVSYSISGTLPSGLIFNTSTGVLSGTPTQIRAQTSYTVTAVNSGGSTTANLKITVNDVAPTNLTYSANPALYTRGQLITSNTPSSSGGAVVSYSVSPSLPAGLSFNTSTGVITGTPSADQSASNYTVTATNTGGFTTSIISISVVDAAPTGLTYSTNPATYKSGVTITNNVPSPSGGSPPTSYSINGALPTGLSFSTTTGVISGKPTSLLSSTTYTVTATNAGGSTTCQLTLSVTGYTIGGTVSGLTGVITTGVTLTNNGSYTTLNGNGSFSFPAQASGSSYAVTVWTQPVATPSQTCTVSQGSGTVGTANVTNVSVTCTANYTLVGSFAVDSGPVWNTNPPVYSCVQYCAILYGGSSSNYACSSSSTSVTHTEHYDCYADTNACNSSASETYSYGTNFDCGSTDCACSAAVSDHSCTAVNYCFTH